MFHGLAKQYEGQVDFLYLFVADPKNQTVIDRLGLVATPHFFLLKADGTPVAQMRGVFPRDSLVRALDRLRAAD